MKTQSIKAKSREWENKVAAYLSHWWPYAERRTLKGQKDKGDVTGVPFTVECKNEKDWGSRLGQYQDETLAERENCGLGHSFFVVPRKRKPVGQAYAVTTLEEMAELLWEAGYR